MTTLEFITMNENGVTTRSFSELSSDEKISLEWAIINKDLEFRRTTPIRVGVCKVCVQPHQGLYCTNCFTGERVRVGARKFAKVIRLHEIKKEVK